MWEEDAYCLPQANCLDEPAFLTWTLPVSDLAQIGKLDVSWVLEACGLGRVTWQLWSLDVRAWDLTALCWEELPESGELDLATATCDCAARPVGARCTGEGFARPPATRELYGVTITFEGTPCYCVGSTTGLVVETQ